MQPTRGPVADRGDQTGQHAVPGQQDLLGQQMAMRGAEQHRRAHIVGPGLPIQPRGEQEVTGLGGEISIPVPVANLGRVPPSHRQLPISVQHAGVGDVELTGHRRSHRRGYRCRVGQEGADRADGDQLQRIPQAAAVVGPPPGLLEVGRAQVADPPQPVPIRLRGERGVVGQRGRVHHDRHRHSPRSRTSRASRCCRIYRTERPILCDSGGTELGERGRRTS